MIRFPAFTYQSSAFRVMAVATAALLAPAIAFAQTKPVLIKTDDKKEPASISAEIMTGSPDREITFERNVEITHGTTKIDADKATYNVEQGEVEAAGHIKMIRDGDQFAGDELKANLDSGAGYVTQPTYKLEKNNGQGRADRIDFASETNATITGGTYSTCEGPDPDWYLKADTMDLDSSRDTGHAIYPVIYFKGVPILGATSMTFPLSNARKSGVLPPTIGTTNRGGLEIGVPYYFNIAPNRDLTVTPNMISQRGLQLGMNGRYLGENYSGQTRLEYLPEDKLAHTDRYAITSTHLQTLSPGLTFSWNLNAASDADYPSDFVRTMTSASQRILPRDWALNYVSPNWNAGMLVSRHQILQDPASLLDPTLLISTPYDRLPQITSHTGRYDVRGMDWSTDTEATRFRLDGVDPTRARGGDRVTVNPKISYPLLRPGYFFTPKLSLDMTNYELIDPVKLSVTDMPPTHITRVLPTFSVDSGLVFERNAEIFGRAMTQTLEPRLFYVYTPYRDQSRIPNFDTTEADLSFAQMFSENRFSGRDRIGDADQITTAIISRYIESNGVERMRFALAQRFNFKLPRVTLNTAASNASRSDILGSVGGQITPTINAEANVEYSESTNNLNRVSTGIQWQPKAKHVLNLQYRHDVRDELATVDKYRQFEVSGQWPFATRWYAVTRVNYSLPDHKVGGALLGAEYQADCWVFRMVAQRIPTSTNIATTGFFVQLELNGLSKLGSNPLETLRTNIPGYQIINKPNGSSSSTTTP
ncbi:MAG TPA: LPS-assembly protein LptD [Burkholderiaceae bacterium]|jgi:LPS-assembly protein